MSPIHLFDPASVSYTYLLCDPATREVLRRYGNMSSATILFVLSALRARLCESHTDSGRATAADLTGVAMAFGPGLVVEMSKLTYVPPRPAAASPRAAQANRLPEHAHAAD